MWSAAGSRKRPGGVGQRRRRLPRRRNRCFTARVRPTFIPEAETYLNGTHLTDVETDPKTGARFRGDPQPAAARRTGILRYGAKHWAGADGKTRSTAAPPDSS